jgi:predicted O-linked N-acetylglucosamine transferase (SPINDLY family)
MTPEELLDAATQLHRAGSLVEARGLYAQLLSIEPNNTPAQFRRGLLELQDGRPDAALAFIGNAIAAAPGEPRHHSGMGQALQALGRWDEARAAYERVVQLEPLSADAHFSLGLALHSLGRYEAAIRAYETAVLYRADYFAALNNLGLCRQRCGRFEQAAAAYTQALALRPTEMGTTANLGTVLQSIGRIDEAIRLLRSAHAREPHVSAHAINLGIALCHHREFAAAESVLRAAWERSPSSDVTFNLGNALYGLGRVEEAADMYRAVLVEAPNHADALINLGNIHKERGEFSAAAASYDAAIKADPTSVVALNNAGCLLRTLGRFDDAEDMFRNGLRLDSAHPALYDNLGSVLKDTGDIDAAIDCFRKSLQLNPNNPATHSNLAYSLTFQSRSAEPVLEECLRWNDRFSAPVVVMTDPLILRTSEHRLRIGYVSPDFREHCQSLFMIPLLTHHDRRSFQVFCYSSVERPDETTHRIAGLVEEFRNVRSIDDQALAQLIRADGIDILVDLTMHMANGRPLVFARKPAPVQVAWLAYPGTTGLSAMDYRLSDARLDPAGFDAHYTERTVRLPDSFWCYHPLTTSPPVSALPALERGYITLGCLNNPCKLTDATLRLWGPVMRALPTARLQLMAPHGRHRKRLLLRLAAQGIEPERVTLLPHRVRKDYLRSYHDIDIGIDTFPYNGHTTSLDAYWMGVPTVSRVGDTCVGRGGLSQSFQLGLQELATATDEGFLDAVVALTSNLPGLAALRAELRSRLERSPLMDGARFAANIETAYREMWQTRCADAKAAPRRNSRST